MDPAAITPPPPEGFELDTPQSSGPPPPPEGFQLDQADSSLPEGFTLDQPQSSALGAGARSFAQTIVPNTLGAIAGIATAAGLAPEVSPFVSVPAGFAAAGATTYAAQRVQDELTDKLGITSEEQRTADATQHPTASTVGELATALPTFGFGLESALAKRALSGAIVGGGNVAQQAITKGPENIDPTEALTAAGVGAALPNVRPWAGRASGALTEAVQSALGRGGGNGNPPGGADTTPAAKAQAATPEALQAAQQVDRANDQPIVASGTAIQQIPVPGAKAPDGTAITQADNERPPAGNMGFQSVGSDRNYGVANAAEGEGVPGAPSVQVDMLDPARAGMPAGMADAIRGQQGEKPNAQINPKAPPPPPAEQATPAPSQNAPPPGQAPLEAPNARPQAPVEQPRVAPQEAGDRNPNEDVRQQTEQRQPPVKPQGEGESTDEYAARIAAMQRQNAQNAPGGRQPGRTLAEANKLVETTPPGGGQPLKPPPPAEPPGPPEEPPQYPEAAKMQRRGLLSQITKGGGDNWFNRIFNPEAVSPGAMRAGTILRGETGRTSNFAATAEHDLTTVNQALNKATPEARWDFVRNFEDGTVKANNELTPAAQGLRTVLDRYRRLIQSLPEGDRINFLQNYLPHTGIWSKESEPVMRKFAQDWMTRQGSAASLQKRSFPSIADGLAAGAKLDPKYLTNEAPNIGKIMSTYQNGIEGYSMTQKALGQFIKDKLAWRENDNMPPGLEELKGRTYQGQKVYAPPDIARVYNNRFGPGIYGNADAADLFRNWMHLKNTVNAATLFGGAYHLGAVTAERAISSVGQGISEMASGDIAGGIKTITKAPAQPFLVKGQYRDIMTETRQQGRGQAPSDTPLGQAVKDLTDAGFQWSHVLNDRENPDLSTTAAGSFWSAWKKGSLANELAQSRKAFGDGIGPGTKETFKIVGRIMEAFMHPLFDYYIPALKSSAAVQQMSSYLMHVPDATPEMRAQTARRISDQIDNALGMVVNSNVFWNPVLKQSLQGAMLSWGWNMGTARYLVGGAMKATRNPLSISMRNNDFDPRTAGMIAFPIVTGAISAIYELLKTGTLPQSPSDLITPRTGGMAPSSNQPERAILPGYQKDILGAYNNFAGTGKLSQEAYNKLAMLPRLAYETMSNQDWADHPIWNPNHPLSQKLLEYFQHVGQSLMPIAAQQATKTRGGSTLTAGERAAGIRQAPSFMQKPVQTQVGAQKANEKAWEAKQRFDKRLNMAEGGPIPNLNGLSQNASWDKFEQGARSSQNVEDARSSNPIKGAAQVIQNFTNNLGETISGQRRLGNP